MSKQHRTSIGGQAVIEGIMMRGPEKTSLAVRIPDGIVLTRIVIENCVQPLAEASFFCHCERPSPSCRIYTDTTRFCA